MNYTFSFSCLLIISIALPSIMYAEPNAQEKIDHHIAQVVGKANVQGTKKITAIIGATALGWFTLRLLFKPFLKYHYRIVEQEVPYDAAPSYLNGYINENFEKKKKQDTQRIPSGWFKSFWQTIFLIPNTPSNRNIS